MSWLDLQESVNTAALAAYGAECSVGGVTVTADFTEPDAEVAFDGASAHAKRPTLLLATRLLPAEPVGLPVVASGRAWRVTESLADGCGLTVLTLERVA